MSTLTSQPIGMRIRAARDKAGLSQGALGQMLTRKRSHVAISDLELGRVRPTVEDIQEIAQLLGVSLESLTAPGVTDQMPKIVRRSERDLSEDDRREADVKIREFVDYVRAEEKKRDNS